MNELQICCDAMNYYECYGCLKNVILWKSCMFMKDTGASIVDKKNKNRTEFWHEWLREMRKKEMGHDWNKWPSGECIGLTWIRSSYTSN